MEMTAYFFCKPIEVYSPSMDERQAASRNSLLNVVLVVLGLAVLALFYALGTRVFAPRADPVREQSSGPLIGDIIQVEIRNGCGISGLAEEMTKFLRKKGFDVVEVGNLDSFEQEYSMVYDRIGDLESAKKLASAVGLPADRVVQEIKLDEYLDASIIIGKDYATLIPFKNQ